MRNAWWKYWTAYVLGITACVVAGFTMKAPAGGRIDRGISIGRVVKIGPEYETGYTIELEVGDYLEISPFAWPANDKVWEYRLKITGPVPKPFEPLKYIGQITQATKKGKLMRSALFLAYEEGEVKLAFEAVDKNGKSFPDYYIPVRHVKVRKG